MSKKQTVAHFTSTFFTRACCGGKAVIFLLPLSYFMCGWIPILSAATDETHALTSGWSIVSKKKHKDTKSDLVVSLCLSGGSCWVFAVSSSWLAQSAAQVWFDASHLQPTCQPLLVNITWLTVTPVVTYNKPAKTVTPYLCREDIASNSDLNFNFTVCYCVITYARKSSTITAL